jgi:hypothetical protein
MVPSQGHQIHNARAIGSPSPMPGIACPYCPRRLRNISGRTRHVYAKHQAESGLDEPDPFAPLSPSPSLSSRPPSPIPFNYSPPLSDYMPPPINDTPPSFNYVLPPADYAPSPFPDHLPPPSPFSDDLPPPLHGGVPDAPSITRTYHRVLDGKSMFVWVCTDPKITCRADL